MKKILKLKSQLGNLLRKADEVHIAAAMMSGVALQFLKENCSPDCSIKLLIGIDLPTPSSLFQQLLEKDELNIEVKIYNNSKQFFHPKVYLIKHGDQTTSFVGSGNFTGGGIENNIEMSLKTPEEETYESLLIWFNKYFKISTPLSEEWLSLYQDFYKGRENRWSQDRHDINAFKKQTSEQHTNKKPEDYNYEGQFLQLEHYQAFSGKKPYKSTVEYVVERAKVRNKLLELHDRLWPQIQAKKWNIHHHHKEAYLTSSVQHSPYTDAALNAVWLHYGRHNDELKKFKAVYGDNQSSLYHMRLQVLIHETVVSNWLTVGKIQGGVVDRTALKKNLRDNKNGFRNTFFNLLTNLPDTFEIVINDELRLVNSFSNEDELAEFVMVDHLSHYFIIGTEYEPNDKALSNENIDQTVLKDFELMLPLYQLIRIEPPKA